MAVEWFFQSRGKILGPFAPDQLLRLAHEGKISQETQVRRGRDGEWVPATRVRGLFNEAVAAVEVRETTSEDEPVPEPDPVEDEVYALLSAERSQHSSFAPEVVETPLSRDTTHPKKVEEDVRTFFNERGIVVSERVLVLGHSMTFAMRHVVALKRGTTRPDTALPLVLCLGGGLLLVWGLTLIASEEWPFAVLLFLIGLGLLISGIRYYSRLKSEAWIMISLSSGETRQIRDPDTGFIDRIWKALAEAIRRCP